MISPNDLRALELAGSLTPKQLEKRFGTEAARWASLQVELRKKARAKFADADAMLFDREALEQATHEAVAKYHSSCFPADAQVVDITAGIGSDLRAFGKAIGFELDSLRAEYARHNCPHADIRNEDGLAFVLANDAPFIWADPDRRDTKGRRLFDPADYQPDPLDIPRDRELTGIKLSPLLQDEYLESVGQRIEFVSYRGECREAIAWSGKLISLPVGETLSQTGASVSVANRWGLNGFEPGIYAVQVETGSVLARAEVYDVESQPGEFIFDTDPAAGRAHALGSFGLPQLGDSPGYLTGPFVESPWLTAYQVIDDGSFDTKRIKESLRKFGMRVFEVKQRGAGLDPAAVMKQLKTDGEPVSLIAWRVEKSIRFAIARRC